MKDLDGTFVVPKRLFDDVVTEKVKRNKKARYRYLLPAKFSNDKVGMNSLLKEGYKLNYNPVENICRWFS